MFCILVHYKKPLAVVDQHLAAHRTFLETGYQKNYFVASGPRNPRTGGVILSQLTDRKKLDDILKEDPFIISDIADYEVIEFTPVKYHPHFAAFIEK